MIISFLFIRTIIEENSCNTRFSFFAITLYPNVGFINLKKAMIFQQFFFTYVISLKSFFFKNFQRNCLFLFIGINILTALKQVITKCCCVWNFINVLDSLAATKFKLNSRCHLVWLFLSKEFHETEIFMFIYLETKRKILKVLFHQDIIEQMFGFNRKYMYQVDMHTINKIVIDADIVVIKSDRN